MAEDGKGIGGFLKGQTGPLPNWAWGLVIIGGIGLAYFLPKLFGGGRGTTGQTSTDTGTSDQSGLGLAIDPTTGLPYAVEGLVPSGGTVAGTGTGSVQPPPIPPTPPTPSPTPQPPQPVPVNTAWTPLLNVWPRNIPIAYGQHLSVGGVNYIIGPGGNGRIWGVPANNPQAGKLDTWNNVPIEPGQKQLLYQPGNTALRPLETQPNWPGGITQTRIGA